MLNGIIFLQKTGKYYKPTENQLIKTFEFWKVIQLPNKTFSAICNRVEAAGKTSAFCGYKKLQNRGIRNTGENNHRYK